MRPLSLVFLLAGCTGGPDPGEVCTVDDATITPGRAAATLDGEPWEPVGVTWTYVGDDVQMNAPPSNGWQLSMVARTDRDGVSVREGIEAAAFPVHVALEGDAGFATLYPSDGASLSTSNTTGGDLQILRLDADNGLVACFSFEAASDEGNVATLEDGQMRANPM